VIGNRVIVAGTKRWANRLQGVLNSAERAAAVTDRMRVYRFSLEDGSLSGTLKIESEKPLIAIEAGPAGTFLVVTQDNRIWRAE
jgi:hypothetical protein